MNDFDLETLWKKHLKFSKRQKHKPFNILQRIVCILKIPEILFKICGRYLGKCQSDGSTVLVTDKISNESLRALIVENRICAIHVKKFCSTEVANALSTSALDEFTQWKLGGSLDTDMFYAGGSIPKEVADHSRVDFYRYFTEQDKFISRQRTLSENNWPVDQLQEELRKAWPFGAIIGEYLGQKLRPAIMRVMLEESKLGFSSPKHGFIHTDDFPKLDYSRGIFTANVYLRIPEEGGELYVWNINLNSINGFFNRLTARIVAMVMAQSYIFDTEWQQKIFQILPEPHVIRPQQGDLVLFHSGRPHSVAPIAKGVRVTNQLFIFTSGDKPLVLGS